MMDAGYSFLKEAEEEEEQVQFFDARDELSSASESCPGSPTVLRQPGSTEDLLNLGSWGPRFGAWIEKLDSVEERRQRFMEWLRVNSMWSPRQNPTDLRVSVEDCGRVDDERIMSGSMAGVRSLGSENGASKSSFSGDSNCSSEEGFCEENFHCMIKNLDDGTVFVADQLGQDGMLSRLREVGSNREVSIEEFHRSLGPSSFVQFFMRREDNLSTSSSKTVKRRRMEWLRRLGVATCMSNGQEEDFIDTISSDAEHSVRNAVRRVKVRPYKKQSKEFSAVYTGQNIKAHDGAILTMRFSPDGQFLATAGEDRVVRVWQVTVCERDHDHDVPADDPSSVYFLVNQKSEVTPICVNKENKSKLKRLRTTPDAACVLIPSEAFRISEKPLHEFVGHSGDVLNLSWSKDNHLLSSSTDKTARLWQVGCDSFVKVFSHSNYVTCVQFDPNDENYFISGSIDGKIRIWNISDHRVVNWIDAREIVTAVCYHTNRKGVVVGTFDGRCLFYDSSDNHLQLESEVLLQGKKKSISCRITGFQFCPGDPHKLMVTSADSQVRILEGGNVICKFKGLRNGGSQINASFTADGKYIISASEDSNVYIWNYVNENGSKPKHKRIWSHEHFLSENASVALSWHNMDSLNPVSVTSRVLVSQKAASQDLPDNEFCCHLESLGSSAPFAPSSGSCIIGQNFFSEFLPKGSATWPEEKLPSSSVTAATALCKSQFKLLKTSCQNTVTSPHAWGQVIVTAGWDGRIRSFHNYGLPVHG